MKTKIKLSIGIPAYNEEANIVRLLNSVIDQIEKDYSLLEIIVASDGSTDGTVPEVHKLNNSKIKVINSGERKGKSYRMNQIIQRFKGDVLFLIDADIIIKDVFLFNTVIKNCDISTSGLIGISAKPNRAENFFQKILNSGVTASENISSAWNQGQNYLSYKGCFLGLSRKFAKQTSISSDIVNNDAYLYFKALELGYRPEFNNKVHILYKSPKYFNDYLGQTKRFVSSKEEMEKVFKKDLRREYTIPYSLRIRTIIMNLFSNPFLFFNYMMIKLASFFIKHINIKSTWNIAISTK